MSVSSSKLASNNVPPISKGKALLLLIQAYGIFVASVGVGFTAHAIYFIFSRILRIIKNPLSIIPYARTPVWKAIATDKNAVLGSNMNPYKLVCVGTGFSGIGLAIRLKTVLNLHNFILLERRSEVGGTWYDNQYPGCCCDVPSNLYSYSFEPNSQWDYFFGRQHEIRKYLNHCADKYHIRPHIRHNSTVVRSTYDEQNQLWCIETSDGFKVYTQIFVNAMGGLSNAAYPKIKGIDSFKGKMMHSAVWDKSYDFTNKTIAVVGTGASSIQLVPELAKQVKHLTVYQRTPAWVVPRLDRKVTELEKTFFRYIPLTQQLIRAVVYWAREANILAFLYRWPHRVINEQLVKYFMYEQVSDPVLREKLMPKWDLGCKRVLLSNEWYSTLSQSHVDLETNSITEVTETGIHTADGNTCEYDCIVWSTGFNVQPQFQKLPIEIRGRNGVLLDDSWSHTVHTYKGITVAGYPNMFLMLGYVLYCIYIMYYLLAYPMYTNKQLYLIVYVYNRPNTGLGHNSIILMIESQMKYITDAIIAMERQHTRVVQVKDNIEQQWIANVQDKFKNSVWTSGGCKSWYLDKSGNNSTLYPGFTWAYRFETNRFDVENYMTEKLKQ